MSNEELMGSIASAQAEMDSNGEFVVRGAEVRCSLWKSILCIKLTQGPWCIHSGAGSD